MLRIVSIEQKVVAAGKQNAGAAFKVLKFSGVATSADHIVIDKPVTRVIFEEQNADMYKAFDVKYTGKVLENWEMDRYRTTSHTEEIDGRMVEVTSVRVAYSATDENPLTLAKAALRGKGVSILDRNGDVLATSTTAQENAARAAMYAAEKKEGAVS